MLNQYDFTVPGLISSVLAISVIETTRKTKDRMIDAQTRRLHELREEAEAANRTKSNFLASVSHEIRTPMDAITGMAELRLRQIILNLLSNSVKYSEKGNISLSITALG
jgi:signal transduction histidine kinase